MSMRRAHLSEGWGIDRQIGGSDVTGCKGDKERGLNEREGEHGRKSVRGEDGARMREGEKE